MIDKTIPHYRVTEKPCCGGIGVMISTIFLRISPSLIPPPDLQAESAEGNEHNPPSCSRHPGTLDPAGPAYCPAPNF